MTLKNARHRFGEFGYEVERNIVGAYRYKARRVGTLKWLQSDCLDWLLTACRMEIEKS